MKNALEILENRRLMATFTVSSAADSGTGSLRAAITSANTTTTADVINFNIPGASKTITLSSPLPNITSPVTIDGATQPGYAASPVVRIRNGGSASDGIIVDWTNTTIRGLSMTEFGTAITVNATNAKIEKCYLGLDPAGADFGNGNGLLINSGGNSAQVRDNVISGNAANGVNLLADFATFTGNIIGLDPTGLLARGNGESGIRITGGDNLTLGDSGDANRNIISANGHSAVRYTSAATHGLIINNYFGLDKTGNVKRANTSNSITANSVSFLSVGVPGLGNRFGGNAIDIYGSSFNNTVTDNVIGVGVDPDFIVGGTQGMSIAGNLNTITNNLIGNHALGIKIEGSNNTATGNFIGILPSGQNVGGNQGVWIVSGSSNYVTGNAIANCAINGVQLNAGANNYFDNATWANGRSYHFISGTVNDALAAPTIQSVVENANGSYTVNVAYLVPPAGTYQIKLYSNDQAGHALSGNTQRVVQTATLISNGSSTSRSYTITGTSLDSKYITATISEVISTNVLGSTAEPSIAVQAHGTPGISTSSFEFETKHTVRLEFTSVTPASVTIGDLILRNRDTLQTFAIETMTVSGNTYRWNRTSPLPDGRYEAIIPAGAVSNSFGASRTEMKLNFHVLAGDADRDGTVDFDDLLALSQNYGQNNKTFSQGDFNYDSKVDFLDLLTLAQRFGTSLFSAEPIASSGRHAGDDDSSNDVLA